MIETLINQKYGEISSLIDSSVEKNTAEIVTHIEKCSSQINNFERNTDKNNIQIMDNLSSQLLASKSTLVDACVEIKSDINSMNDKNNDMQKNLFTILSDYVSNIQQVLSALKNELGESKEDISVLIKASESKLIQVCNLINTRVEKTTKTDDIDEKFRENEKILLERTEKLEKVITDQLFDINESSRENFEVYKNDFQLMRKTLSAQYEDLTMIIDRIKSVVDSNCQEVKDGTLLLEKETQQIRSFVEQGIVETAKAEELEKVLTDMELIRESLGNLWTIMKAIWIDSLLDDVEKSVK